MYSQLSSDALGFAQIVSRSQKFNCNAISVKHSILLSKYEILLQNHFYTLQMISVLFLLTYTVNVAYCSFNKLKGCKYTTLVGRCQ